MMEEVWKDVQGFEGRYQVSNLGRVRSLDRFANNPHPRFLKGQILRQRARNGYYIVSISDGHRNYSHFQVHRLVALHFVDGYKPGLIVNHKNEIKTDNRAENLEWCTYQYNLNYSDVIAWKRKPVYQYDMAGNFVSVHKCCAEVEKLYGTYMGAMAHIMYESKTGIWNGYRWSFEQRTKEQWQEIASKYTSSRKPVAQLSDDGREIARFNTMRKAADKMGVSVSAISHCCRGKTCHAAGFKWKIL